MRHLGGAILAPYPKASSCAYGGTVPTPYEMQLSEEERAIALQLKTVREEAGFSRSEMAQKLGFSLSQIGRIETASRSASIDTMIRWFAACGYRLETVSLHETGRSADLALAVATLNDDNLDVVIRFARLWPNLSADVQRTLLAMITANEG